MKEKNQIWEKNNLVILFIIILFFVFFAYSNHFSNDFAFDDSHVIKNNVFVRDIKNIPQFFTDARTHSSVLTNQVYRPLLLSLFALEYLPGQGLQTFFFHISSFTFYILLGILVFLFVLKIFDRISPNPRNRYLALFAFGWYLLNPANTETVNYIFQQSEIIAALGVIGSFLLYIFKPKWRKSYFYLLPMAIASFAKISSLIFIPLFFIYILLFEKNCSLTRFFQKSFWLLIWQTFKQVFPGLIAGVGLFIFIQSMNASTVLLSTIPRGQYLLSQPPAVLYYLYSFFFPLNLSADHGWDLVASPFESQFILAMIVLIVLLFFAVRFSKKSETRPISFGIFWFFIALLPTSSIFPLSEIANDHRAFLSYIGLTLAITWGLHLIFKNKKLFFSKLSETTIVFFASAILITSVFGTYNRNKVWYNGETLWYDVIQKNPQNARGLMNYALSQMEKGRIELAQHYLKLAYPLAPRYHYLLINLGIVAERLNNQDAEAYYKKALDVHPNNEAALYYYANFLNRHGQSSEAIEKLYYLIEINPAYLESYYLLIDIYIDQYDIIHASEIANKVLQIIPNDLKIFEYLNKIQKLNTGLEEARLQVEKNPTIDNLFYLGFLNIKTKNFEQAIELNKQVIELDPNYIQAYNNLGTSYNILSQWDKAIEILEQALIINPDDNLIKNNLNHALEQQKLIKSE